MPCDPNNINFDIPDGPAGPTIPGFGNALDFKLPNIFGNVEAPDLSGLFDLLSILLSPGKLKSPLNPNYGRDIMDNIIKLLDSVMPYLMLYKFFLPLLKLILCVLEIACALPSPKKTARAVRKLFRECIPAFLNLFPIFALLMLIISLFLLILQLLAYILLLILRIIELLLRNIKALNKALKYADENAIIAIARKIGLVLCLLQNLFVVFLMIEFIFSVIKDILSLTFNIPPCDSSDANNSNCCSPDVCPQFLQGGNINNSTGQLICISQVDATVITGITQVARKQSFQLLDPTQSNEYKQFINMIEAKDIIDGNYTIFYPTDSTYTASTPVDSAPYTVDVTFYYTPSAWGRNQPVDGNPRNITFKDCIVVAPTSKKTVTDQNGSTSSSTGTLLLSGGKGYEANGDILKGYDPDNSTQQIDEQATLNNFLFKTEPVLPPPGTPLPNDSVSYTSVTYTFKPNYDVLLSKALITYGCDPRVAQERTTTNTIFTNEANDKLNQLRNFQFPDVAGARECAFLAIDGLRIPGNLTEEYVTNVFQPTIVNCLQTLSNDTKEKLKQLIPIGFDQYKSTATLNPTTQFTTQKIKLTVDLKTTDGNSLVANLPPEVASSIAENITANATFGEISEFTYDGSNYFLADISSATAGSGQVTLKYNNIEFYEIITPESLDLPRTTQPRVLNYQFIYTTVAGSSAAVGIGDQSDGQPRRDEGDVSRDGNNSDGGN